MNTTLRPRRGRTTRTGLAAIAALSLLAAACGDDADDDADAAPVTDASATTAPTADDMSDDSMADDDMSDDTMADDDMTDDTMADDDMTEDTMADDDMSDDMMGSEPFGPACASVPASGEGSFAGMADDPAATAASNNPELSTLVAAVTAAGLGDTLNGEGPFTIFAPANSAFAQIPQADLDALLADPTGDLTNILTYHVVAGERLDAASLGDAGTATTVNGATLEFGADGTTVNGVNVVCSDIPTANATVHIIDAVLLPAA